MINTSELEPGKLIQVHSVPVAITRDHNQVYYFWQKSGIRNATLLHIDGHSDMSGGAVVRENFDISEEEYYQYLSIGGFIVPAVHYGLVSSIFWLNPHSQAKKLQDLGSSVKELGRKHLRTRIKEWSKGVNYLALGWTPSSKRTVISPNDLKILGREPFIWDIDLDAFCCDKEIAHVPSDYHGIEGFENRIAETMDLLRTLRRPDLITITRSEGREIDSPPKHYEKLGALLSLRPTNKPDGRIVCTTRQYVDPQYLPEVERQVLCGLENVLS
jgi:hypothetical protein